jgi:hypothetical protein
MNCGCSKNLGCFAPGQTIDFGFANWSLVAEDFIFHIWTNGTYFSTVVTFDPAEQIQLTMAFNENSMTMIKIELPSSLQTPGSYYATSPDGACCFEVNGIVQTCL